MKMNKTNFVMMICAVVSFGALAVAGGDDTPERPKSDVVNKKAVLKLNKQDDSRFPCQPWPYCDGSMPVKR